MFRTIDSHSHYMPPEVAKYTAFFKVNWSDVDRQLAAMDQSGISKSLLLYPTSDAHLNMDGWQNVCDVYNEELACVVKRYNGKFIGAGILPIDRPQNFKKELAKIKKSGLSVLSLASSYEGKYLSDEIFEDVFNFAAENNMPVHVHPQILNPIGEERVSDPLLSPVLEYVFDVSVCIGKMMMEGTFIKHGNVKFIFAHYGGVLPLVKERFDNTYSMLRSRGFVKDLNQLPSQYFKNLFFDTSGSKSNASLLCALELVSATNILYGSDYPANQKMTESIEAIKTSSINEKDKGLVLGGNLLNLLELHLG